MLPEFSFSSPFLGYHCNCESQILIAVQFLIKFCCGSADCVLYFPNYLLKVFAIKK